MRYTDFRDAIQTHLAAHPEGCTWADLREALSLPYDRPCPTWVASLEREIGLRRTRGAGRALLWTLAPGATQARAPAVHAGALFP